MQIAKNSRTRACDISNAMRPRVAILIRRFLIGRYVIVAPFSGIARPRAATIPHHLTVERLHEQRAARCISASLLASIRP